jgi:hypothetical protein
MAQLHANAPRNILKKMDWGHDGCAAGADSGSDLVSGSGPGTGTAGDEDEYALTPWMRYPQ